MPGHYGDIAGTVGELIEEIIGDVEEQQYLETYEFEDRPYDTMSMVDVPLGELLDPFTPDPEAFMEDYGAYFRPYDPSQEIRLKRAYELKQAGAMSDLGQDLYDAQNIIGKT